MEFSTLNGYKVKDKKAIRYYDTVADMKADTTLKSGMHVKTKGYYSANDGGNGEYYIKSQTPSSYYESLTNNLYAELIHIPNEIDIACLGAKYNDNTFDSATILQYAVNNYNNILINGDIYLGNKIVINRNYVSIIQNSGKIYPTFNNDDLFRITGWSDRLKVFIDGTYQEKPNTISTEHSALFIGDGGTEAAEKGRKFNCSYTEISNFYGNGIKHVNGAFGDYTHTWINFCSGHGFYFPGGCKDNQHHRLEDATSVLNKGNGFYQELEDEQNPDTSFTHDTDGVLRPGTMSFNNAKGFGNAINFYIQGGGNHGTIYSEYTSNNMVSDIWSGNHNVIDYLYNNTQFTDTGENNSIRYWNPWSRTVKTDDFFNKLTIETNRIGKRILSHSNNNEFTDEVIGSGNQIINVKHIYSNADKRIDQFGALQIGDVKFEAFKNLIVQGPNVTLNAGETYNYRSDSAIGQMWISLTATIPKLFVTAYTPEGIHVGVTASLYARGSSGFTPIELHITNHGSSAINLSDCQFYVVAMN